MTSFIIPKIVAHRGASIVAPENTLIAFEEAKNIGCNWVEFDVELSKDGVPVIMHDEMVDRTTTGHGPVDSFTLKKLKTFDAGIYKGDKYSKERILTLDETLAFFQKQHMHANIELKSIRGDVRQNNNLATQTIKVLKKYVGGQACILISSFSPDLLAHVRQAFPSIQMGFNIKFLTKDAIIELAASIKHMLNELECYSLHVNEEIINAETITLLKEICPNILCWTVNTVSRANDLYELGVQGIFTDDPSKFFG